MADATSILNEISGALDGLAAHSIDLIADDRSFLEMWGWNLPAMGRLEFADFIRSPRDLIQKVDPLDVSDVDLQRLSAVPARIQYIRDHSFPQLPGGNHHVLQGATRAGSNDAAGRQFRNHVVERDPDRTERFRSRLACLARDTADWTAIQTSRGLQLQGDGRKGVRGLSC